MGKSNRPTGENGEQDRVTGNEPAINAASAASARAGNGNESGTGIRGDKPTSARTGNRRQRSATVQNETREAAAQIEVETQTLGESTAPPRRQRAASTSDEPRRQRKKATAEKVSATQAAESATMLLEMVQLFAATRFGPDAAFTAQERLLIEPSLARLIERYGSVAQQFSWIADPLLLAVGVGMYGVRIAALVAGQRGAPPADDPGLPPAPPQPPAPPDDPGNGATRGFSDGELMGLFESALGRL